MTGKAERDERIARRLGASQEGPVGCRQSWHAVSIGKVPKPLNTCSRLVEWISWTHRQGIIREPTGIWSSFAATPRTVRTGRNIDGSLRICIYCWDWEKMRLHER